MRINWGGLEINRACAGRWYGGGDGGVLLGIKRGLVGGLQGAWEGV